ncbi:apolipoprotein N-acyltransferase [bacterium]|nr:apolipoprotein N-acyltransferase [bacterium]
MKNRKSLFLKKEKVQSKIKIPDIFLALLSGVLTALAFPKFQFPFLAWISLLPLLLVIVNKNAKHSFLLGLLAGISFYLILIYWIPSVPSHYGNLSWGLSLLIYLLFVLYLALFWAFFSLVTALINQRFPKIVFAVIPFLWVSFEYLLAHLLTGFPWGLLGNTQFKNIYFIQLASLVGVYGLSFVMVFFQSMFVYSFKQKKVLPFLTTLLIVGLIHGGGNLWLKKSSPSSESFTASVIQGNVSSDIYWHKIPETKKKKLFSRHLILNHKAQQNGAQLIIWPEFSVPLCFSCSYGLYLEFKEKLFQFVEKTGCTLLLGTNEINSTSGEPRYFNTALCLHPDLTMSQYHKMHLVPFGEYTPLKKIFSFIQEFTHAIGEITPGKKHILHQFQEFKFGSPICYEIIFPDLVRKFAQKGAQFLVTITNDGWYGKSSAPYQHFSIAVLRAVENRRYILRAATTGISGIIDPYGRILTRSHLLTPAVLTHKITPVETQTFYTRHGNLLPLVSLTLGGLFFILSMVRRKK